MAGFSGEEKLDLLYKKVAFGVNKSGTSEQFLPSNETSSTYTAIKPSDVWQDASPTNVPSTPPTETTTYVKRYAVLEGGSQPTNTTAVVECTANPDSLAMPGQTNFTRSWKTGLGNWIGPGYGAGYLIKVYVGPSGWDGNTTNFNVTQVIFGADQSRDWFFDYEAGMLYWTNDNENGSGVYEDSDIWDAFSDSYVVYVAGYTYIGARGVGGQSAAQVTVTETDAEGTYYPVFVTASGAAVDLYADIDDDDSTSPLSYNPLSNLLTVAGLLTTASLDTGTLSVTGDSTFSGNVVLGTDSNNNVDFNGEVVSSIIPNSDSYSLGSVTKPWSFVYAQNGFVIEGTANNFETILQAADATADRTITLPDATGTVALTSDLTNFLTSSDISTFIEGVDISDASDGTPYKLALTTGTNGTSVTTQFVDTEFTYTPSGAASGGTLGVGNIAVTGNATIAGNLTVSGNLIQQDATVVTFEDAYLNLNVPTNNGSYVNGAVTADSGFFFTKTIAGGAITEYSAMHYDNSDDLFKFTRYNDSTTGAVGNADNLAALKFGVTDVVSVVDQSANTTTIADASNETTVRSLGGVSKSTIEITSDANDVGNNYAPVEAAANGYLVEHNLNTTSVFVVALRTHDATGNAISTPQVVYCNYLSVDANTVRVTLGIAAENEKYDILVIG